MSAYGLGRIIGLIIALVAPIATGYAVSRTLTERREGYDPVRWPVVVGYIVSSLMLLVQCSAKNAGVVNRNAPEVR